MAGLPRAIIKKYGVSKRAWAVYRGTTQTKKRTTKRGARMARRYGRRRSRSGIGGGKKIFGLGTKGILSLGLLGVGAGAFFGETIGSYIPYVKDQSPMVKGAIGAFLVGGPAGAAANVAKQAVMGSGAIGGSSSNAGTP